MKIKLSQLALDDLESIACYISQDKPDAAQAIIKRTFEAIENLIAFPTIGRTGRVPHTRELVIGGTPLIIIYRVKQDTIFIARIIHSARKWPV